MEINREGQSGMYFVRLRHTGLGKHRLIRGRSHDSVEQKVIEQQKRWDAQWKSQRQKGAPLRARRTKDRQLQSKVERAQERTDKARTELAILKNLLHDSLKRNPAPDFAKLSDRRRFEPEEFKEPRPESPNIGAQPKLQSEPTRPPEPSIPERPNEDAPKYRPVLSLLDRFLRGRKERAIAAARSLHQADVAAWSRKKKEIESTWAAELADWEVRKREVEEQNASRRIAFEEKNRKLQIQFETRETTWRQRKESFEQQQRAAAEAFRSKQRKLNSSLKQVEQAYSQGTSRGVADYCALVLSQSDYPRRFPKAFEIHYSTDSKLLLVEYSFPRIDQLSRTIEVIYQPNKDAFIVESLSESALNKLYDDVLYQITLRSLHELFEADQALAIDSIVFNGWVHAANRASGRKVNTCVLSIHARRQSFQELDLRNVDPKACFRLLKGIGSSDLHGLAAIAPIMRIDKADKRFIEAYGVADNLNNAVNLAAMDWEDFEHLVREIFEKEFAQYGGEVKITQASRDGGVDAVAFDPDPIRGGKIVIQAKRYTNVVGLSAVRDLYGTVVNEGAIKGILVTTAAYGPDAYEFAKDKPLTLLNGSNLLHMLEKHGHRARIDLGEAKRLLAQ